MPLLVGNLTPTVRLFGTAPGSWPGLGGAVAGVTATGRALPARAGAGPGARLAVPATVGHAVKCGLHWHRATPCGRCHFHASIADMTCPRREILAGRA
jgi:hypothetical protein